MPSILHPGRWRAKPPLGSRVDTSSPFGLGLVGCFLLQREHPTNVRNLISGKLYGPGSSNPVWEEGIAGLALDVDGSGVSIKDTAEEGLRLQTGTLLWRGYIRSTPADFSNFAGVAHNNSDSNPYTSYVFYKDNTGKLTFGFNNGAFQANAFRNISDFVGNGLHQFVFTFNLQPTTANQSAYTDDGSLDGTGGTTGTITYDSTAVFQIGDTVGGRDGNSVCQCVYIWNRVLPRDEIRSLWREPFQMIAPPRSIISYSFPQVGIAGQTLTGSAGIVSGEAMGSNGVVAGAVTGTAGIASAETFPTTGAIVSGYVGGESGIPTGEAFGANAVVTGPINGAAGIPSAEAFGSTGESVTGPIVGVSGIPTGEAFGSTGESVTGPITGSAGIPSAAAMGSNGYLAQPLIGSAGIPTGEAFGAGEILVAIRGYLGIPSEEAFGRSAAVFRGNDFNLLIRGVDRIEHLKADTMNVTKEMDSRSNATFILRRRRSDRVLFRPLVNDEVIYLFRGRRIFGGFITQIEEIAFDARDDEIELRISCGSYRKLAENRVYSKSYEGSSFSMRSIVTDLFEATLEQEGISFEADEDQTVTAKRFKLEPQKSVDQHLDYIASVFGATWRIDDYRRLRINRTFYEAAPSVIEQNGLRFDGKAIHRKMLVNRNDADYRNRQGLRTGVPVAGQQRLVIAGNGGYDYTVGWAVTGKPVIKVDGTPAVVVEASDAEVETGSYDFYYTLNSNRIRHNPAQAAYTAGNDIEVISPSSSLDVFFQSNAAEIARRAARTGGTGLVEVVSSALPVRDQAAASAMAGSMMERFGAEAERISWESDIPFWDIGQMVHVRMTAPLVAGLFMIESVSIREVGATYLTYSIRAAAFTLPRIVDITYEEGAEPGSWEVKIVVDRNHGIEDITDGITLWGIDGWEPIWGSWTVDPINETTLHFEIPASANIDLTGLEYNGGLGGSEGGGTGGYGGTGDPFGGVIFSPIPPGATDTGVGVVSDLLRIVDVNVNTLEVTTNVDHGFESSFPVDGGYRVSIWGVKGCDNPTTGSSINHVSTRVQITGTNKFIPKDVGPLTGADGFVNNGEGYCAAADRFDIASRIWAPPTSFKAFMAAATPGENLATDTATFILSNSIPGIASRPLAVAANVTNAWTAERDITAVESVSARIETPADGAPVLIDLKKNGVSIFAAGTYLEIPSGVTEVRNSNFADTPLLMEKGDKVTVDVVGVGSDFPGCNATVHMNMRG